MSHLAMKKLNLDTYLIELLFDKWNISSIFGCLCFMNTFQLTNGLHRYFGDGIITQEDSLSNIAAQELNNISCVA